MHSTVLDLQSLKTLIEDRLNSLIPYSESSLVQAARYSLLAGGKRLRPLLTLATVQSLGKNVTKALNAASALEMVHTYSMIHDDLPCMDDDDLRRGQPSCHRAFTEATAVLAGDFLFTKAQEVVLIDSELEDCIKIKVLETLDCASGAEGMIGGQMLDLEAEGKELTAEAIKEIHAKKTGALISAAVTIGGYIAEADEKTVEHLKEYGEHLGLLYQIVDDILDVSSDTTALGKPAHSDEKNQKSTYVKIFGLDGARQAAKDEYTKCLIALDKISCDPHPLKEITNKICSQCCPHVSK